MYVIIINKIDGMKMCRALALQGYYNKLKPVADYTYELHTNAPKDKINELRHKIEMNKNIKEMCLWSK